MSSFKTVVKNMQIFKKCKALIKALEVCLAVKFGCEISEEQRGKAGIDKGRRPLWATHGAIFVYEGLFFIL